MLTRRLAVTLVTASLGFVQIAAGQATEEVIIRTAKPYANVIAAIQAKGGTVTRQFKYIDAIAARMPQSGVAALAAVPGVRSVQKDVLIAAPRSTDVDRGKTGRAALPAQVTASSIAALSSDQIAANARSTPAAYLVNNTLMGLDALHAAGLQGQGVVVAVIDSGIRPGFPHIAGSVIGGEDFVGDGLGFSNFANDGHGTFVSGMIAAHVAFGISSTSVLAQSLNTHAPGALIPASGFSILPVVGTAPAASIYALRVFGPAGGSPNSRVLAAMERVIELREKYNAGQPGGVNIRVCNMSLGGSTVAPGIDLGDEMVDAMLAKDIVTVVAAGNSGPAALTLGSPSSSRSALSVGAANLARNERVLRDLQYGLGIGSLYRAFSGTEMAYFSGRGPNADGRVQPHVVANGFANFGMGLAANTSTFSLGSGTSFSTPSVSGIAAVLRQAFPNATARQIRNAIMLSANPGLVTAATAIDQGHGYVNASAARALLAAGSAPDTVEPLPNANSSVKVNVEKSTELDVLNGNVRQTLSGLKPGERRDIVYRVNPNVNQVVVSVSNFSAALPAASQNQLFGDDLLVAIHSSKTSSIGEGDYKAFEFTRGATYVIDAPERGLLRVSVSGDWTNAGAVSAVVSIFSTVDPLPKFTSQGKLSSMQAITVPFNVQGGASKLEARLEWRSDWGNFPSADFDMYLVSPSGKVNVDGAQLNNPEGAVIEKPEAGQWIAIVDGFYIPEGSDKYELRIAVDGNVVK